MSGVPLLSPHHQIVDSQLQLLTHHCLTICYSSQVGHLLCPIMASQISTELLDALDPLKFQNKHRCTSEQVDSIYNWVTFYIRIHAHDAGWPWE